jgi:small subunit ribosomal protein S21
MLRVEVNKGNIERALKELKGKFKKNKVPKECRNRQEYTKKSVTKRSEKLKAIYLQKKYNEKNN